MHRGLALMTAGLLPVLSLTQCSAEPVSEPCTGTVSWDSGSLPPQYANGWTLTLNDDGTASFSTDGGHNDTGPLYTKDDITTDPDTVMKLCNAIQGIGNLEHSIEGGQPFSWKLSIGEDYTMDSKEYSEAITIAEDIIGTETMSEGKVAVEEWAEEHF